MRVVLLTKELGSSDPGAPRVVFVHGINDSLTSFQGVAERLSDFHCVLFDRRGWGSSVHVLPRASTSEEHANDLAEVIGDDPATVIGHSIGGVVAMHAAVLHPTKVVSLGLYEPAIHWADWWTDADNEVVRVAAQSVISGTSPSGVSLSEPERAAYGSDLLSSLNERFDLDKIRAKAVIGYGTRSTEAHRRSATRLAEVLDADLVAFEGAKHSAHRTHPEDFARLVRLAVAKNLGGRSMPTSGIGGSGLRVVVDEQPLD